ncbi:MAG: DUF4924 family protein [Rikenellaceae bacterium]
MDIAQSKRKENIAEYILYLWQLEDILRALQFSPEAIYSQLVSPRVGDDEQRKQDIFLWYMELTNLLREEGKEQVGHLNHTLHLINDLQDLHNRLMTLPVGENYRKIYASASIELPKLKEGLGKKEMGDIEICFRALYAVVLYRIKGDESKQKDIEDVISLISPLVAELATIFKKAELGEIDLFKEE